MNVYCFDELYFSCAEGLMLVAANSETEAIKVAIDAGEINDFYGFVPKCYLISELTANVNVPKVIKAKSYFG